MANKVQRPVLLDTNVIISALVFGGKPEVVLRLAIDNKITAVTSPVLLAELSDILYKKFDFTSPDVKFIIRKIKQLFQIVNPKNNLSVLADKADNRVLEAAIAGKCRFIITGDKELLALDKYQSIQITSPAQFIAA